MARMPNLIYYGHGMGLGQGISNLGQALFGDPAELRAEQAAKDESALRQAQLDLSQQTLAANQRKLDSQQSLAKMITDYLTGGQGAAAPAPAMTPASQPQAATAPAPAAPSPSLAAMFDSTPVGGSIDMSGSRPAPVPAGIPAAPPAQIAAEAEIGRAHV